MIFKVVSESPSNIGTISIKCPSCGRDGSFEIIPSITDLAVGYMYFGQRKCPNRKCLTHIFFIYDN